MTHTVRKLNNIRYHLASEVEARRQKIVPLENANVELIRSNITLQNEYHIL